MSIEANVRMTLIGVRQVNAARALLGWSQMQLASASGVSHPTIARLEAVDGAAALGGSQRTIGKIKAALEAAGIVFICGDGGSGVRLKRAD